MVQQLSGQITITANDSRGRTWITTGIPLAATLSGGNRNDVTQLIPLLQAVPPVRGKRGRPGAARTSCWEIRDDIHEAFRTLGCALICWRRLNSS